MTVFDNIRYFDILEKRKGGKIMNRISMVLFLLMMVCVSDVYTQSIEDEIESLRGLKGVWIVIENLEPDIEKDGLKRDQIQTDIKLKLWLAGIKVLTKEEWVNEPGRPYLYVRIGSLKDESELFYAYCTELSLCQDVYLDRNTKINIIAETWSTLVVGLVGKDRVVDFIRDNTKDLVDEFISDYLSVNPK